MPFFVTTLKILADKIERQRTVGFFDLLEEAQTCIKENYGDLWEIGWYDMAVIEKLEAGLYPFAETKDEHWYAVDFDMARMGDPGYAHHVIAVNKPTMLEGICSFALG